MDTQPPTKIILTGQKAKTIHKEELTMSRAERGVQQSISDNASSSQKRRTDRLKQEQNHGRLASPAAAAAPPAVSSSSAPATPTKASPSPASNKDKKIRVTTSDGRQAMLTLPAHTTYHELQRSIAKEFALPTSQQCIRYGFPPKELAPPRSGEEGRAVALQHGDRVIVEILRAPEQKPAGPVSRFSGSHSSVHAAKSEAAGGGRLSDGELQDSIDLETSSLCLLATLMGKRLWAGGRLSGLAQVLVAAFLVDLLFVALSGGSQLVKPHVSFKGTLHRLTLICI